MDQAHRTPGREVEKVILVWQPIETAPKDGTWVLGWKPSRYVENCIETYQWRYPGFGEPPFWVNAADSNDWSSQPTHWMPLPDPPTLR